MSYMGCFRDYIQARDAASLQVYMTNEPYFPDHLERNNRALFEACRDGVYEICEVLIRFGADVNFAVVYQQTPLFTACWNAHPACVDLLVAHGTDVNAGDLNNGQTPLMAVARVDYTLAGLTLDQFLDNRCRCMRSLLEAGVVFDQTRNGGRTALMDATWNVRLTEILVEAGANVNIMDNTYQKSALHYACGLNSTADVVELLLERGANINAVNVNGWTSLHLACSNVLPAAVKSLIRHGANIDIVDNYGCTALKKVIHHPATSPNRVAVLQLMATCSQTRLEASLADWIRLARNDRN